MQVLSINNDKGFLIRTTSRNEVLKVGDGNYKIVAGQVTIDGVVYYLGTGDVFIFSFLDKQQSELAIKTDLYTKYTSILSTASAEDKDMYLVVKNYLAVKNG